MDLVVLLWKQEGTEAGSLTFLCLLFKKPVMSVGSGNLLSMYIYFYNYMEISGTWGVMGEMLGQCCRHVWFWGTNEFFIKLGAFNQVDVSKPWILGICIPSFDPDHQCLLWVLISRVFGKCCLQFVPPELQLGDCCNNHWFFSCLQSVWLSKTRWGF